MTTENIDIQISDKISSSISVKLKTIASESRDAQKSVELLQKQLNSLDSGALSKITSSLNTANNAISKAAIASQRLATEQKRTAVAAQKLATEQANTAKAMANAEAATIRAETASARLKVAQDRLAKSQDKLVREGEKLKRSLDPLYDQQQRYNQSINRALQLYEAGAIDLNTYTEAIRRSDAEMKAFVAGQDAMNRAMKKTGSGVKLQRYQIVNLGYQLNDIGVSLASGQNPLIVFIQQGSQIAGIAAQAGLSLRVMAGQIARILVPFLPFVIAVTSAVVALKAFSAEASKGAGLDDYARSLGATDQQIRELNLDTVTLTDSMKGLWDVFDQRVGASDLFGDLWANTKKAFSNVLVDLANSVNSELAILQSSIQIIPEIFSRAYVSIKNGIVAAVNFVAKAIEGLVNKIIQSVNTIISALNSISSIKIDPFKDIKVGRLARDNTKDAAKTLSEIFNDSITKNTKSNRNYVTTLAGDWKKSSQDEARKRIKSSLSDSSSSSGGGSNANALQDVNRQLDMQAKNLLQIQPLREASAKFDRIEQGLLKKHIVLNKDQAASIKAKIDYIQKGLVVQRQMDAIYSNAVDPLKNYNAALTASSLLLKSGAITQQQYTEAVTKASEAYQNSADPLRQYNKDIKQQLQLLQELPARRAAEQKIMQIQNSLLAKGIVLNAKDLDQLRQKLAVIDRVSSQSQKLTQIYNQTQGALVDLNDQQTAYTQALNDGFISADTYSAKLNQLAIQAANVKNQMGFGDGDSVELGSLSGMLDGFTNLADGIAQSISETFSALADGISQSLAKAIVSGENLRDMIHDIASNALTQLLASLIKLGIQYTLNAALGTTIGSASTAASVGLAATTAAAWAPAAAAVSLASYGANAVPAEAGIATTYATADALSAVSGFKDGGYTGSGGVNDIAGVVHGQEYVMDATATNRIGADNLRSLQTGAASVQKNESKKESAPAPASPVVNVPFTAVVVQSKDAALDALKSTDGQAVILETIEENGNTVARIVGAK